VPTGDNVCVCVYVRGLHTYVCVDYIYVHMYIYICMYNNIIYNRDTKQRPSKMTKCIEKVHALE
jgi:hypothetical protein